MINRLDKYAEKIFPPICYAADVLCHRPDEDENGWDYFLEFPQKPSPGPADSRTAMQVAFVQIKSSKKRQMSCQVKLSNALKAAQSEKPWFVVLIHESEDAAKPIIYARHVWSELIAESLKAVRLAENDNSPLHRRRLTIRFSEADIHSNDVATWMWRAIDEIGLNYEQTKKGIYQSVGYESGYGVGKVTIVVKDEDEIIEHFLGRGGSLNTTSFLYTPERFGVPHKKGIIKKGAGILKITPTPAGTCEIRLRGRQQSESATISGEVYTLGLPSIAEENQRYRFVGEFVDVIYRGNGETRCSASFDPEEKFSLGRIERFLQVIGWSKCGDVDIQVWARGHRILAAVLNLEHPLEGKIVRKLLMFTRQLRAIAGPSDAEIKVSLAELGDAAFKYRLLDQILDLDTMTITFEVSSELRGTCDVVMYYITIHVAEWSFNVLIERDISEDRSIGTKMHFVCSAPVRLEAFATLRRAAGADELGCILINGRQIG